MRKAEGFGNNWFFSAELYTLFVIWGGGEDEGVGGYVLVFIFYEQEHCQACPVELKV